MSKNNKGFTLIEVIIAMFILMIGMLALLNTAAVMTEHNLINILRDEAVRIGEQKSDELRNTSLTAIGWTCSDESRLMRSVSTTYNVCYRITNLSADGNTRQLDVAVGWDYKGTGTLSPTNRKYQHSISSIIRVGT